MANPNHVKSGPKGGQFTKALYHGTTVKAAKSILTKGLQVSKAYKGGMHRPLVWTTNKKAAAKGYGRGDRNWGKYAVIKIKPQIHRTDVISFADVRTFEKDIPASEIMKVEVFKFTNQGNTVNKDKLIGELKIPREFIQRIITSRKKK